MMACDVTAVMSCHVMSYHIMHQTSKRTLNRQALKLEQMTGTTHDQRMSHAIDKFLLDPATDEGKARTRFLVSMTCCA